MFQSLHHFGKQILVRVLATISLIGFYVLLLVVVENLKREFSVV